MIVPRRLYSTVPYEQTTAETLRAEGEEAQLYLICPEGGELHDVDAAKLGIEEYLKSHPDPAPEEKAVEQGTTEDKAVAAPAESKAEEALPPESPDEPGVPGEVRIGRSGRRP